ncbi:MAG: spore germination protein GerW family protein [Chloroflexota bacterium]
MTFEQTTTAQEDARRAAGGMPDQILEKLVERVGGKASVQAVFGEPIQRGTKTVIPVAKVRWGFGGGTGTGPVDESGGAATGSGSGAGGGVTAEPIGYLEIAEDGASFKPIASLYPSPLFLLAAGLSGALVIRAVARLVRG